jgi:PPK2 family polyphosphate:nucleotide phosphotransferase
MATYTETLRAGRDFSLADLDPRSTPGFTGGRKKGEKALAKTEPRMSDLQERLYAQSKVDGTRSLLLVVQGMDTSGKGGIMRHVVGQFDPQGVHYTAFKAPTPEERQHDFLWRIRKGLSGPGQVGVFDRSHYEDVLIVRVHNLVPPAVWHDRYALINEFEREVAAAGTTIVKVMLHVSYEEQGERLMERLDNPDKNWKWNPGDVAEREHWHAYMTAYQAAITKCSTDTAPWFVVPADRKWYARLAVANLVREHLEAMDLQWPEVDFDVEEQKAALAAT